jgi:arylsulfatase A
MSRTFAPPLVALLLSATAAPAAQPAARPNVLFILTDDQGWSTLGCYGGTRVATPHLDRLAADGARFTQAYVTPQCTPTRAALLTGQHPARTRMWHVIPWYGYPWAPVAEPAFREHLPRDAFTLAKGLRAAGYVTGMAGKWHLTTNDDGNYVRLTPPAGPHYGFDHVAPPGPGSQNEGDKHVDHLTAEAIKFIDANRARPWFFLLAHHTLHGRVSAPPDLVAKYRANGAPAAGHFNATYLAAVEHLDTSVGRLVAALDERKLRDNTVVVFLSDNGGVGRQYDPAPFTTGGGVLDRLAVGLREYPNDPLRGEKGTLYEGGIRVPCLVRWPGAARAGLVCDAPVQATDWLPTLFEAAGARAPDGYPLDGRSLRPLLTGGTLPERSLYWYAPLYDLRWGATPAAAVRRGPFKLVEHFGDSFDDAGRYRPGRRVELYDLGADRGEATDLAARHPDRVKALRDDLHAFLQSVGAEVPGPNPRHDPTRPFLETRRKPAD